MPGVDLTIEICGMSGDGTIAAGTLLNEALSGAGFSIIGFDSYPAEIRGFGRCVTRSRFGTSRMLALSDHTHVLISLDDQQAISRISMLGKNAKVLFDNKPAGTVQEGMSIAAHTAPDADLYGMPFTDLASEAAGTTRGKNLAALGCFTGLAGIDPRFFYTVIEKKFRAKGETVLNANLNSFNAGLTYAHTHFEDAPLVITAPAPEKKKVQRIMLSGNAAIARGALDAGLALYFGYPITPATPIMEYLAKTLPQKGGKVVQMEDEISSIGAVLGSFYAGKRAMTATSGPGLALMAEMISLGVMSETPAVIVDAQRGGPSTGLPTKTEQSDLHAAVFGGPGDSPRIVIAPTDVAECYQFTLKSFELAEKYQTPVIVLTDFFLDNRVENVAAADISGKKRVDGNIYPPKKEQGRYQRYLVTPSGISPRALPGSEGYIYPATGLEHTEAGLPDYSEPVHMQMNAKRHTKIRQALADLPPPKEFSQKGPLDLGVIAWGSSFGAALEAVLKARKKGLAVGALKVISLFPYHEEQIRQFMSRCRRVLIPELNFQGQLANLIGHLHHGDVVRFNRTTGTPLLPSEILLKIQELLQKDNT